MDPNTIFMEVIPVGDLNKVLAGVKAESLPTYQNPHGKPYTVFLGLLYLYDSIRDDNTIEGLILKKAYKEYLNINKIQQIPSYFCYGLNDSTTLNIDLMNKEYFFRCIQKILEIKIFNFELFLKKFEYNYYLITCKGKMIQLKYIKLLFSIAKEDGYIIDDQDIDESQTQIQFFEIINSTYLKEDDIKIKDVSLQVVIFDIQQYN